MSEGEVKSDVQEMNKAFGLETAEEPEPEPEPPAEEPTNEEPEGPEEETTEDPEPEEQEEEEAPSETEEGTEPEEETEPEEIIEDERDKLIAELRKKLDEKEAEKEPEPEPEPTEEPITFEAQSFIKEDEDIEDLISDPSRLNEVFNNVYQRAVTDTRKALGEGILRDIPNIVRASVDVIDKLKQMNDKFYADNKDLEPFKKVVASVFEEVASDNPGKDMMKLLPMVADESRRRLELHKKAVQTPNRDVPRLPRRKRRSSIPEEKPNTNPLLNELEEMNKIIRR